MIGIRCRRSTSDHLSVADAAALRVSTFSIEVTFRVEVRPGAGEVYTLISKGSVDGGVTVPAMWSLLVDELMRFGYRSYNAAGSLNGLYSATDSLVVGRWYSGAVTSDGTTAKLYLASRRAVGYADPPTAYTQQGTDYTLPFSPVATSTEPVRFGASVDSSGTLAHVGNVTLAEVRLYNAALAKATMDARLRLRLVGNEASLIGYWRLDDGLDATSAKATDRASGTGRDATFVNRPVWSDAPDDLHSYSHTGYYRYGLLGWTASRHATVTATTAAAAYPVSALLSPRQDVVYRSTGLSSQRLVWDQRQRAPFGAVLIGNHNLTSSATITLAANDTDSWGSPAYTETVAYHPTRIAHLLPRPQAYRYVSILITDAANPDGYLRLGLFRPLALLEFERASMLSDTLSQVDPSVAVETPHGDRTTRALDLSSAVSFELPLMRAGHAHRLRELLRRMGSGEPVWLCRDAREPLHSGRWGYLASPGEIAMGTPYGLRDLSGMTLAVDRAS